MQKRQRRLASLVFFLVVVVLPPWGDFPAAGRPSLPNSGGSKGSFVDLFPLPSVDSTLTPSVRGLSRTARRNFNIRQRARVDAQENIHALNALYGCNSSHSGPATAAQSAVVRRMLTSARATRHANDFTPEGAARELLGPRFDYGGDNCTVVPFDPRLLSLPSLGRKPVPLDSVLDDGAKSALVNFETQLLADPGVVATRKPDANGS